MNLLINEFTNWVKRMYVKSYFKNQILFKPQKKLSNFKEFLGNFEKKYL